MQYAHNNSHVQTNKKNRNFHFFSDDTLYIKTKYEHSSKCSVVTAYKHDR